MCLEEDNQNSFLRTFVVLIVVFVSVSSSIFFCSSTQWHQPSVYSVVKPRSSKITEHWAHCGTQQRVSASNKSALGQKKSTCAVSALLISSVVSFNQKMKLISLLFSSSLFIQTAYCCTSVRHKQLKSIVHNCVILPNYFERINL